MLWIEVARLSYLYFLFWSHAHAHVHDRENVRDVVLHASDHDDLVAFVVVVVVVVAELAVAFVRWQLLNI